MNFSNQLVCFMDTLGFKAKIHKISNSTERESGFLQDYVGTIDQTVKDYRAQFKEINVDIKIMSDSIVLSCRDSDINEELRNLVFLLKLSGAIQGILAEKGFWLRGGVSSGRLFTNEEFITGEALISAYELESKNAISPRIIVHPKIVANLGGTTSFIDLVNSYKVKTENEGSDFKIVKNSNYIDGNYAMDEFVFIDFLEMYLLNEKNSKGLINISKALESDFYHSNPEIMRKKIWLRNYIKKKSEDALKKKPLVDNPKYLQASLEILKKCF